MVARKLSSFDTTVSLESYCKQQRPSIYIDPESNIYEGLQYLQNIDRENCVNCIQLWRSSNKEGKSKKKDFVNTVESFRIVSIVNRINSNANYTCELFFCLYIKKKLRINLHLIIILRYNRVR